MKIKYVHKSFSPAKRSLVDRCNAIIAEYQAQRLDLTLRQLYYQLVARDVIPNKQSEYKRLGKLVADARLAGLISWKAIEDRTRNLMGLRHYGSPAELVRECEYRFHVDRWADQANRVEVWVEKQALEGVVAQICTRLDVPYFSCRGYTSISEMWAAAQRLAEWHRYGQKPHILHLGDLDPSGADMSRDIVDRLKMFLEPEGATFEFERLALNPDQVRQYRPPPNPAKTTDSRFRAFALEHGNQSWELDALDPRTLQRLIENAVDLLRDVTRYNAAVDRELQGQALLRKAGDRWRDVVAHLEGGRRK